MKQLSLVVVVVGLIQCQEGESKCFESVCYGNPNNQIRGCDPFGCGHYDAPRGNRRHRGIDIVCTSGFGWVYSPFPAEVVGESKPYGPGHPNYNKPFNTGIKLEGTGDWKDYEVLIFYVSKELDSGEEVDGRDFIGFQRDRTVGNPGMTNHVHLQLYKNGRLVDPTPYVC